MTFVGSERQTLPVGRDMTLSTWAFLCTSSTRTTDLDKLAELQDTNVAKGCLPGEKQQQPRIVFDFLLFIEGNRSKG
ncbi:MAG: hypothetical protein ACXWVS_05135 [Hyphomicrobium sp.]